MVSSLKVLIFKLFLVNIVVITLISFISLMFPYIKSEFLWYTLSKLISMMFSFVKVLVLFKKYSPDAFPGHGPGIQNVIP